MSRGTLSVHIRMGGQIYLSGSVLGSFPITNEHRTANIYVDVEKCLVAILPLPEPTGYFNITNSGTGKHISCSRFLDAYNITRNQKCVCTIEDVEGEKMIVFRAAFND